MKFTDVEGSPIRAEKVSGTGALYYYLRYDEDGREYVQIVQNYGGGGASVGSFSTNLYLLSEIGEGGAIRGYDPVTAALRTTEDNNMSAFLRAVKSDVVEKRKANSPS